MQEKLLIQLIQTKKHGVIEERLRRWCALNVDFLESTMCGIIFSEVGIITADVATNVTGEVTCKVCLNVLQHAKEF